jgi:hypothetical protein
MKSIRLFRPVSFKNFKQPAQIALIF